VPTRLRSQLEALAQAFASSVVSALRAAPLHEIRGQDEPKPRVAAPPVPLKGTSATAVKEALQAIKLQRAAEAEVAYRLAVAAAHATRDGGIDACAAVLGVSRQTLAPYALVASQWTAEELRHLLAERRTVHGDPISISHLVELAKLAPADRDRWLERTFAQGLTVRELRAGIWSSGARVRGRT
jgi:hypothetical protein